MSFILEALKKSEKQQQKKNRHVVRTVYEPAPGIRASSRFRGVGFLILLLVNISLWGWFFSPWQTVSPFTDSKEQVVLNSPGDEGIDKPHSATVATPMRRDSLTPETHKQQSMPLESHSSVTPLPVPRSEKKVYLFSQLPLSIQKRLPTLKMSLHAFNRDDASASLVQLNDHILREGGNVTDRLHLEKITADGVVLSYDGYRFLLPRRGNK